MGRLYQRIFLMFLMTLYAQFAFSMTIDKIIVFGDSLSDNGNIYELTKRASRVIPNLAPTPKSPPYYDGRFTNGQVWVEHLAQMYRVPLLDYAFGGSWAEPYYDSHHIFPFGLATQVYMYLGDAADDMQKDKHLFVIWSGGNDYAKGRDQVEYATSNTVLSIRKQIEYLINAGARQFLVVTLPDLGVVPGVVKKGKKLSNNVSQLTRLHNQKLIRMIKLEKKAFPNVNFAFFNATNHMNNVVAYPDRYHIKNTQDPCYKKENTAVKSDTNYQQAVEAAAKVNLQIEDNLSLQTVFTNSMSAENSVCMNPDEYLFWDEIHPTRKMHQMLANEVFHILNKIS